MKEFISEYGLAILVIAVIVIMIAITTPVGDIFKNAILGLFDNLGGVLGGSAKEPTTEEATTTALNMLSFRL